MTDVIVYEKPTCTTCRRLADLLTQRGIDFDRVNYIIDPLTEEQLATLLRKAGLRPRDRAVLARPPENVLGLLA